MGSKSVSGRWLSVLQDQARQLTQIKDVLGLEIGSIWAAAAHELSCRLASLVPWDDVAWVTVLGEVATGFVKLCH